MNNSKTSVGELIVAFIIGAIVVAFFGWQVTPHPSQSEQSLSAYNTESAVQIATSSTIQVGPQQAVTIFSDNEFCGTRMVSTLGSGVSVILSFDPDITPSATTGHPVVASTTTALPASQYGCGAVRAYAFSSTTITRSEFIQ